MRKSKKSLSILSGEDYRAPKVSAQRAMGKIKDIATSNSWDYFCTLTWAENISRDYWAVQKMALRWKKDVEKGGGKVLLVIGCGAKGGLYHVHALVYNMPDTMITPGSPNAHLIRCKTDGALWSLAEPEKYDVGLHVVQEVCDPDNYNRIADYMAGHVPELRRQFHDGMMANVIDRTAHMYFSTRGLKRSRHGSIFIANTDDKDRIHSVIDEELSNISSVSDSCVAAARIRKRLTHRIKVFSNGEEGTAIVMPAEVAHLITDAIIPVTTEKYTKYGKVWYRFVDTLEQLANAFSLSYVPVRGVMETCSEWLAPYLMSEQDRVWLSASRRARTGEIPLSI